MTVDAIQTLPRRSRISFIVPDEGAEPAHRWETKLGGAPYLPKDAQWPTRQHPDDPSQSVPLGFVAQLNLSEVEAWRQAEGAPEVLEGHLPTVGILQFYLPLDLAYGQDLESGSLCPAPCLYWPQITQDDQALAPALVAVQEDLLSPVEMVPEGEALQRYEHGLPRWQDGGGDQTPLSQPRFPVRMTPAHQEPEQQLPFCDHVDVPDEIRVSSGDLSEDEYQRLEAVTGLGGTQLGGYPMFTQEDPRPHGDLVLLFQLDDRTSDLLGIGDVGTMGFFIPSDDLPAQRFDRVVMAWDCY